MKSALIWIASFIATFYVASVLILYIGQRSFLYFPDDIWVEPADAGLADFETVEIGTSPQRLRSWWRAPPTPDAPVILHFHGNGGSIAGRAGMYGALAGDDFGLLAAEYPGYAGNDGEINEAALFASAQAHYDWLIARGIKPRQIIIAGQSLGTGVSIWLAARNPAAGLLLEAPYSSIREVAQGKMPWVPVRLLLKDPYDSLSRIDGVKMPLAWVHGGRDNVVPFASGEKLFAAAAGPKCKLTIEAAGHNDLWAYDTAKFFRANAKAMVAEGRCVTLQL